MSTPSFFKGSLQILLIQIGSACAFLGGALLEPTTAMALTPQSIRPIVAIDRATNLQPVNGNFQEGTISDNGGVFSFGYVFQVSNTLDVNALGVFDALGDGVLNASHNAYLFDFNDPLIPIASTTLAAGTCSIAAADFCWSEITTLSLMPGFYAVAADGGWDVDGFAAGGNYEDLNSSTAWAYGAFYDEPTGPSGPFPYFIAENGQPGDPFDNTIPIWGANVSFTTASVPAPMPGLAAVAFWGWSRRLRRRMKGSTSDFSSK